MFVSYVAILIGTSQANVIRHWISHLGRFCSKVHETF